MIMDDKGAARQFLTGLERHLNSRLPARAELNADIAELVRMAKASTEKARKAFALPEGALLNRYIIPNVSEYLTSVAGLDAAAAREALLSESYRTHPATCCGTPSRSLQHPFSKAFGVSAKQVVAQWRGAPTRVTRSCPDLAIRSPHKVVFEAKFFRTGSAEVAEKALVEGIYQAFFYRGLPVVAETTTRPAYDYEYGCLLIVDGSEGAKMAGAWRSIKDDVQRACWVGANVYVMVLRGLEA